jgi:hypothetical protein
LRDPANARFIAVPLVRLFNSDSATSLITIYDTAANTQVGNFYLGAGAEVVLELPANNAITANGGGKVVISPIAYRY